MKASELKEILEQHRLWIETNGVQGQYANLTHANLTGAILYRADLNGANLTNAYLGGANLTVANLEGANLEGAYLEGAILTGAYLMGANLNDANLTGANLTGANLSNAILPDVSWVIPGCLVQLNHIKYDFYLAKDRKYDNFVQDSIGFFIQDNVEEKTFDMLLGDRIIRNIPRWVKCSGMSKNKD